MSQCTSKTLRILVALMAGSIGLGACENAGFRSGGNKSAADGQDPNLRPWTPTLDKGGWMTPQAQDSWKKMFDEASTGSDPSRPPNPSSPGGPGSDGGGKNGGSGAEQLLNGVDGVLWIPCGSDPNKVNEFNADFTGKRGSRIRLSGEFCPTASAAEVTVLFVIDHSGSMENALSGEGPNDPTSANGCRRLDASKLLVERYAALKATNVKVGVVNFASRARIGIPITGISEVQKRLDPSTFCGLKDDLGSFTNYEDAFSYARKALADIEGPKVVYFITDGSPTASGSGAQPDRDFSVSEAAGLKAAKQLRDLDDVSMNALFVGYTGGLAKNPRGYLEEITGDPESVRVTKDANDLVKAAASLNIGPVKIAKDDTSVLLKNPSGDSDIGMNRVTANPSKLGAHIWVTDPFVLVGTKDQVVKNILTATAKTSTGDSLKTVATINFKQLD